MYSQTQMQLKKILKDHHRGAEGLLRQTIAWFIRHPDTLAEAELEPVLGILRRSRVSMACFGQLADRLEEDLATHLDWSDIQILEAILKDVLHAEDVVTEKFASMMDERGASEIVTLSYSSSVLQGLTAASDQVKVLHVLESKPGAEGRKTRHVASENVGESVLHLDADIQKAVDAADMGLIGADTVFADGSVLNKVLSAKLGNLLKEQGKPLYVLATSWKWSKDNGHVDHLQNDDRNLFELVPADLITSVISDK